MASGFGSVHPITEQILRQLGLSSDDVTQIVSEHKPGETVKVVVLRDGVRKQVKVKLASRPAVVTQG